MSAAEVVAPRRSRPVRAWFRLLGSELGLVFGRRRNRVGLGVLFGLVVLVGIALKVSAVRHPRSSAGDLMSAVAGNGIFLGFAGLSVEIALFLPLAVSVLAGDAIAGEANQGTLRYLLIAPVARGRLLVMKAVSLVIGGLVGATGRGPRRIGDRSRAVRRRSADHLVGHPDRGSVTACSGCCSPSPTSAAGLGALSMIGLFISTLTEQPIAATVATAMVSTLLWILDAVPQLDWLHPWLLVDRWMSFVDLLRDPIFTDRIVTGLWVDAAYAAVFLLLAWLRFRNKDVTS